MPLDFVLIRASEVPQRVTEQDSFAKAGITGSDILWNEGFDKDSGFEVPLFEYYQTQQPNLIIGYTDQFADIVADQYKRLPVLQDLSGWSMATKYTKVAAEFLAERNIPNVKIRYFAGSDEAAQYLYPDCISILALRNTGKTLRANNIDVLEEFYQVTARMIEASDKISASEKIVLDDLKDRIDRTMDRKRKDREGLRFL